MSNERIYKMTFSSIYPMYVQKAEKKGRTKEEVDTVICWLTSYDILGLQAQRYNAVQILMSKFMLMMTISPYPFFVTKIGSSDSRHISDISLVFFKFFCLACYTAV